MNKESKAELRERLIQQVKRYENTDADVIADDLMALIEAQTGNAYMEFDVPPSESMTNVKVSYNNEWKLWVNGKPQNVTASHKGGGDG